MRASPQFIDPQAARAVLARRPALRAHTEPPEPVMPPPPPPDLPTGVPPIGDPLPWGDPSPSPGPAPDMPGMPPEITRAAHRVQGQGSDADGGHVPMMTQPATGRAPRFERPSTFRRSLLRSMSGPLPDCAH